MNYSSKYQITNNYIYFIARSELDPSERVFGTATGSAPKMAEVVNWAKANILKDKFGDLTKLCPKAWRKGWAMWAQESEDPEIRRIATRVMCHSEEVRQSNYNQLNREDATRFANTILRRAMDGNQSDLEDLDDDGDLPNDSDSSAEPEEAEAAEETEEVAVNLNSLHQLSDKKVDNRGNRFGKHEMSIFVKHLMDGSNIIPINDQSIERASAVDQNFRKLYQKILTERGNQKSAKNSIRKCLESFRKAKKCPVCRKAYKSEAEATAHLSTHHITNEEYTKFISIIKYGCK